jgi:hypothetical protein
VTGDLGAWQIHAFELAVSYDPDVVEALGASSVETLTEAWGEPAYHLEENRIAVAHAGTQPVSGSGSLLCVRLRLRAGVAAGTPCVVAVTSPLMNEGTPIARGRSASITIQGDPVVVESVTVVPSSVSLPLNALFSFEATVISSGDGEVVWCVNGSPDRGTIDASGVYRSPALLPDPPTATIVATSVDDEAFVGTAHVALQPAESAELVNLVVLRNPANPHALQVMVSAAEAFLAPPAVDVDGAALNVVAVDGSLAVYRGCAYLLPSAATVTVRAEGTTSQGSDEAEIVLEY